MQDRQMTPEQIDSVRRMNARMRPVLRPGESEEEFGKRWESDTVWLGGVAMTRAEARAQIEQGAQPPLLEASQTGWTWLVPPASQ